MIRPETFWSWIAQIFKGKTKSFFCFLPCFFCPCLWNSLSICWMEFGLIPVISEPIPFFKRQCSSTFISSFLHCNEVYAPFQRNCVPASISSFPNKFLIASHRKVEISDTELKTGTDSSELKQDPSNREPKRTKKVLFSP